MDRVLAVSPSGSVPPALTDSYCFPLTEIPSFRPIEPRVPEESKAVYEGLGAVDVDVLGGSSLKSRPAVACDVVKQDSLCVLSEDLFVDQESPNSIPYSEIRSKLVTKSQADSTPSPRHRESENALSVSALMDDEDGDFPCDTQEGGCFLSDLADDELRLLRKDEGSRRSPPHASDEKKRRRRKKKGRKSRTLLLVSNSRIRSPGQSQASHGHGASMGASPWEHEVPGRTHQTPPPTGPRGTRGDHGSRFVARDGNPHHSHRHHHHRHHHNHHQSTVYTPKQSPTRPLPHRLPTTMDAAAWALCHHPSSPLRAAPIGAVAAAVAQAASAASAAGMHGGGHGFWPIRRDMVTPWALGPMGSMGSVGPMGSLGSMGSMGSAGSMSAMPMPMPLQLPMPALRSMSSMPPTASSTFASSTTAAFPSAVHTQSSAAAAHAWGADTQTAGGGMMGGSSSGDTWSGGSGAVDNKTVHAEGSAVEECMQALQAMSIDPSKSSHHAPQAATQGGLAEQAAGASTQHAPVSQQLPCYPMDAYPHLSPPFFWHEAMWMPGFSLSHGFFPSFANTRSSGAASSTPFSYGAQPMVQLPRYIPSVGEAGVSWSMLQQQHMHMQQQQWQQQQQQQWQQQQQQQRQQQQHHQEQQLQQQQQLHGEVIPESVETGTDVSSSSTACQQAHVPSAEPPQESVKQGDEEDGSCGLEELPGTLHLSANTASSDLGAGCACKGSSGAQDDASGVDSSTGHTCSTAPLPSHPQLPPRLKHTSRLKPCDSVQVQLSLSLQIPSPRASSLLFKKPSRARRSPLRLLSPRLSPSRKHLLAADHRGPASPHCATSPHTRSCRTSFPTCTPHCSPSFSFLPDSLSPLHSPLMLSPTVALHISHPSSPASPCSPHCRLQGKSPARKQEGGESGEHDRGDDSEGSSDWGEEEGNRRGGMAVTNSGRGKTLHRSRLGM